jgi:hypothetical protein
MKTPRSACVVIALVAVCILVAFALRNIIMPSNLAGSGPAEAGPHDDASAPSKTGADDEDEFWLGGPGGGFGDQHVIEGIREDYTYPKPLIVWIEAMFLQVAAADLEDIRIGDQPAFRRGSEKLLLTGEERGILFDQLRAKPSFRIIASASVTTISGQQAVMQFTESLPYLTQRDTESAMTEARETEPEENDEIQWVRCWPALELEEIEVGVRLNVTPTISSDERTITLVLLPEVAQITGWADFGSGPPQPLYRNYNVITTIYILDGMSVLMPGVPLSRHGGAAHPNVKPPAEQPADNTVLILITARLIELPVEEEPQTDQAPAEPPNDADLSPRHDDPDSF